MTTTVTDKLIVGGVDYHELATGLSWEMEYTLVDSERPFGPEYEPVKVREIHAGGIVWGFLVAQDVPGKNVYSAVSELLGDEHWHFVLHDVEGDDDALDAAGRAVIADHLVRSQIRTMESKGQL